MAAVLSPETGLTRMPATVSAKKHQLPPMLRGPPLSKKLSRFLSYILRDPSPPLVKDFQKGDFQGTFRKPACVGVYARTVAVHHFQVDRSEQRWGREEKVAPAKGASGSAM